MDSDIYLSLDEYIEKKYNKQVESEDDEFVLDLDLRDDEKEFHLAPTNLVNATKTVANVVDLRQRIENSNKMKQEPFTSNNNNYTNYNFRKNQRNRIRNRMNATLEIKVNNNNNNKNCNPLSLWSKKKGKSPSTNLEKHNRLPNMKIQLRSTVPKTLMSSQLTNQATSLLNMQDSTPLAATQTRQSTGNDSLKSLLGINEAITKEMMPMMAAKFLDLLKSAQPETVHKPVYDMKIQQDIHRLQGKSLIYKCPGGEVISSDGAGINCIITPNTSGMSLNYRFG